MKKIILIFFIITLICFSFCACEPEPLNNYPTRLWPPTGAKITEGETTVTLSWDEEPNARSYDIRVWQDTIIAGEGVTYEFISDNTALTSYTVQKSLFIGRSGRISFSVVSIGKKNFTNSNPAIRDWNRDMLRLASPANLDFDYSTGILTWGAVSGADDYLVNCFSMITPNTNPVFVFEKSTVVTDTSSDFSEYKHITPLAFEVQARNADPDVYDSYISNRTRFAIPLDTPKDLTYDPSRYMWSLSWEAVEGAVSYDVSFSMRFTVGQNQTSQTYSTTNTYFDPSLWPGTVEATFFVRAISATNSGFRNSEVARLTWTRPN